MINRILIRIKVVQILYSYLLTRSEFKIDTPPEVATRDRKYAYSVYKEMLLLLLELSGYNVTADSKTTPLAVHKKLLSNKAAKALSSNDTVRSIILRGGCNIGKFDAIAQVLHDRIVESAAFKEYSRKRSIELADDVNIWATILQTVILKDKDILSLMRQDTDYSSAGFQMGVAQLIDTLKGYSDSRQLLAKARKDLAASLDKGYELYLSMFQLMLDITSEQERRIEAAKEKYLATAEDLNPNMRLVDNALRTYLLEHEQLGKLLADYHIQPAQIESPLVKKLLDSILESDLYKEFALTHDGDFSADVEFWREVFKSIIFPSSYLVDELEDRNIYWNDDLQIIGTFMLKTLRQISNAGGKPVDILPKYKDDEDAAFGEELFNYAVKNYDLYRSYVERFVNTEQWDPERLAFMDIVVLVTAIAEIVNYPAIPVAVSINEYVEIANTYSTERSGAFVNGILYSVVGYLNAEGVIHK